MVSQQFQLYHLFSFLSIASVSLFSEKPYIYFYMYQDKEETALRRGGCRSSAYPHREEVSRVERLRREAGRVKRVLTNTVGSCACAPTRGAGRPTRAASLSRLQKVPPTLRVAAFNHCATRCVVELRLPYGLGLPRGWGGTASGCLPLPPRSGGGALQPPAAPRGRLSGCPARNPVYLE